MARNWLKQFFFFKKAPNCSTGQVGCDKAFLTRIIANPLVTFYLISRISRGTVFIRRLGFRISINSKSVLVFDQVTELKGFLCNCEF